ncbi:MAG: hypothetical protein IPK79_01605 [Vampirovibrionales bacterium]|nr:hypothetical protein [Vampirovibrionales bacterium]
MVNWMQFFDNQRRYNRGQGVVEYAGALTIAAVLTSLALVIVPNPLADLFFQTLEAALTFLRSFIPA